MARSDLNNPTARMGRVLDDFDALDYAYDEMAKAFAEAAPDAFQKLTSKPSFEAVASEKTRRQLTLAKGESSKNRMRRYRTRSDGLSAEDLDID